MSDEGKETILFVSANYSSFVRQDAEMLAKHFRIKRFEFGSRKGLKMLEYQFRLFLWLLKNIWSANTIFVWFGDYHSFFPTLFAKLLGRISILIIGGYDAAKMPEYNYGGHNSKLRSWFIRKSCNWASRILPVSDFVRVELSKQIGKKWESKSTIVYNGVDVLVFPEPIVAEAVRNGVICVSFADTANRVKIKGLDRLTDIAASMPETTFTIVGVTGNAYAELEARQLPNVILHGKIDRAALGGMYRKAKVVCQFSRFESFGMALAEGMLCGCIPVTMSGIGAAEVLDAQSGFVVNSSDLGSLIRISKNALSASNAMAIHARERIQTQFSIQRREEKILAVLKTLGVPTKASG